MNDQPKHPIQPLITDEHGIVRFKTNKIVERLLDEGGFNMNDIACWDVSKEDRMQFAQLIGYSLSGYEDLGYVTDDNYLTACQMQEHRQTEQEAELEVLRKLIETIRTLAQPLAAELFPIHPDDLDWK